MQEEPRKTSFSTLAVNAAWMTLASMMRLSYRNSAGYVSLAKIPPTFRCSKEYHLGLGLRYPAVSTLRLVTKIHSAAFRSDDGLAVLSLKPSNKADPTIPRWPGHPDSFVSLPEVLRS